MATINNNHSTDCRNDIGGYKSCSKTDWQTANSNTLDLCFDAALDQTRTSGHISILKKIEEGKLNNG